MMKYSFLAVLAAIAATGEAQHGDDCKILNDSCSSVECCNIDPATEVSLECDEDDQICRRTDDDVMAQFSDMVLNVLQ